MFLFGTPEDTAKLYVEEAAASGGGGLKDVHYQELELRELQDLLIYLRIAYYRAARDTEDEELVSAIVGWHDEVFLYLLEVMDDFRMLVCSRIHKPIGDWKKYHKLAGCGSAN
jgi:hypothetical protein